MGILNEVCRAFKETFGVDLRSKMGRREDVLQKLNELPDALIEEVIDFIEFLKVKSLNEKFESTFLSESSLMKDWLRPEEDEAWRDL